MAVRRLLRPLYKMVHPDLTPTLGAETKLINQNSLMRLNAYVDILEDPQPSTAPFIKERLTFFRPYVSRRGVALEKASPIHLTLPSIPPLMDVDDRDFIAAELIRDVENVLETPCSLISDAPDIEIPSLFEKESAKDTFNKVWWEETQDTMALEAIYENPKDTQRRIAMELFRQRYEVQFFRRANKLKTKIAKKKNLALVKERVEAKVKKKFANSELTPIEIEEQEVDQAKRTVIENGFHPDLVFFQHLTKEQKQEGIQRMCGLFLKEESDIWLQRNLWKTLREDLNVALILDPQDKYEWKVGPSGPYAIIPYNFDLHRLVDLVEENLE